MPEKVVRARVVASAVAVALVVSAALLSGGCKSTYAKGTPFYTGPVVTGGERANLWPLAYYQDPNLSVLWPMFERTPDHLAVRPLWSVYGLDERAREYNVFWPFSQFDFRTNDHRVFPFFWGGQPGNRYFVGFPEVWWFQNHKAVLPFFWGGTGDDRYFVGFPWYWSFRDGGCAFPFFWSGGEGDRRYVLFPEVWWSREHKAVLPFFWGGSGDDRYFVAFPWFWSWQDGGCAFPFFWGGRPGARHFVAFPEVWWYPEHKAVLPFFWGGSGRDRYFVAFPEVWWLPNHRCIPPVYWSRDGRRAAVFPLFWYERDAYCHLLPLWLRFGGPGGSDTHVLWPLVNRRNDAESTGWRVWPLAGDYRARGRDYRYSFALWPLGHYRRDGDERMRLFLPLYYDFAGRGYARRAVLPFYYGQRDGQDSMHLTPLYWAGRSGEQSWSVCLPLYYRSADAAGRTSRLVTPLFADFREGDRSRLLVYPALASLRREGADRELWALGPLVHSRWGGAVHQGHALPFYCYDREQDFLFTPLYARGGGATPWSLLVPFYYRRSDPASKSSLLVTPLFGSATSGGRTRVTLLPLLSAMKWDGCDRSLWALGPLAHFRWGGERLQNHVLPLYYYDREERLFLSPLYAQGGAGDRRWSFLLPAYWHQSQGAGRSSQLLTPLFGRWREGDGSRWLVWPALSSLRSQGADRDLWMLGPLARARWGGGQRQSHVFPLYYRDRESDTFVSLPFSRQGGEDGFWNLLGLGAHGWRSGPEHSRVLVPPALSFYRRDGADRDLWTLGPLARFRWGGEHHQSHVFPLYYRDRETGTFVSLPFSRRGGEDGFWNLLGLGAHGWRSGPEHSRVLVPPALSFYRRDGADRDLWTLGPLVHARWGGAHRQSHVLPLYAYDREEKLLLTLPFSYRGGDNGFWNVLGIGAHGWRNGPEGSGLLLPPALTYFGRDRKEKDLWTLGGLVHARWGGGRRQNHILPFYYYDRQEDKFLSIPFSRQGGPGGYWNVLLLLANSADDDEGHRTVRVLPPFTAFAHSESYGRASVYPLFSTSRRGDFRSTWVFPWAVTEGNRDRTFSEFLPFWWYESQRSPARGYGRNFHVLGWLYDDHQENIGAPGPKDGKGPAPAEHVRKRILWKIWDYERIGQDVAVDAFPFISYDRRPAEGLKRFSFAWRLFRWERSTAGGRKLDVLFIPLMRRAGEAKVEPAVQAPAPEPAPEPSVVPVQAGAGA